MTSLLLLISYLMSLLSYLTSNHLSHFFNLTTLSHHFTPHPSTHSGYWKNGQLLEGNLTFKDGLTHTKQGFKFWDYCSKYDPRFYSEVKKGLDNGRSSFAHIGVHADMVESVDRCTAIAQRFRSDFASTAIPQHFASSPHRVRIESTAIPHRQRFRVDSDSAAFRIDSASILE
jgi:hypothetical protein